MIRKTSLGAKKTGCCTGADVFTTGLANVGRGFLHKTALRQEARLAPAFGVNCCWILHADPLWLSPKHSKQMEYSSVLVIFIEQEEHFLNHEIVFRERKMRT